MAGALAQAGLMTIEASSFEPAAAPPAVDVSYQVEIQLPKTVFAEESSFIASVYFRLSGEEATPTTVEYRIDDLTGKQELKEWTSNTAWPAISFLILPEMNEIKNDANNMERRQLTIRVDGGLETQVIKAVEWQIKNLQGIE
jgi:hypothetical protein